MHAHHTQTQIKVFSHSRPKRLSMWLMYLLYVARFCPKPQMIEYNVNYTMMSSLTHMMSVQVFCTPHMFQHTGTGNILPQTKGT